MKIAGIVLLFVLIIALIGIGPVITIWSLNTLFNTGIAVNIWTWLSTVWLCSIVASSVFTKKG